MGAYPYHTAILIEAISVVLKADSVISKWCVARANLAGRALN